MKRHGFQIGQGHGLRLVIDVQRFGGYSERPALKLSTPLVRYSPVTGLVVNALFMMAKALSTVATPLEPK